jgi:hypothetical protein
VDREGTIDAPRLLVLQPLNVRLQFNRINFFEISGHRIQLYLLLQKLTFSLILDFGLLLFSEPVYHLIHLIVVTVL